MNICRTGGKLKAHKPRNKDDAADGQQRPLVAPVPTENMHRRTRAVTLMRFKPMYLLLHVKGASTILSGRIFPLWNDCHSEARQRSWNHFSAFWSTGRSNRGCLWVLAEALINCLSEALLLMIILSWINGKMYCRCLIMWCYIPPNIM